MKVEINGTTYLVGWKYDTKPVNYRGIGQKEVETTTCFIKQPGVEPLAEATVVKHVNDVFNKDKARRFALDAALRSIFAGRINSEVRKNFWNSYLTRNQK